MILNPSIKSGVVIVDKKPYYYIDLVSGTMGDMVLAFNIKKQTLAKFNETNNPNVLVKNYMMIPYKRTKLLEQRATTELSKHLLDKLGKDNTTKGYKLKYEEAIFASPVEEGIDTITSSFGLGFKEMSKTHLPATPTNKKSEEPVETGVFIGLNNVLWLEETNDSDKFKDYIDSIYNTYMPYFRLNVLEDGAL